MKTKNAVQSNLRKSATAAGHTLPEVVFSAGMLGFMLVSLYAGFSSGFAVVRVARENLRATQILEERMEVLRLIKWDNVKTKGYIPRTFTEAFDPNAGPNASSGIAYSGIVTITNSGISEAYSDKLQLVQIDLTWTSGNVTRNRKMVTYVSQYGLQNYIY